MECLDRAELTLDGITTFEVKRISGTREEFRHGAAGTTGVDRVALPAGLHSIETVNSYLLADGERVTVVDCGVWRPTRTMWVSAAWSRARTVPATR